MRCPYCNANDTQVKDSRQSSEGNSIKRRRFCPMCGSRFTTHERIHNQDITVIKKDGAKRPFDREKLYKSIAIATRKRSAVNDNIDNIIDAIISTIEKNGTCEISTNDIGELVIKSLAKLDDVAYVRFASVYHDFDNVRDFEDFLSSLEKSK